MNRLLLAVCCCVAWAVTCFAQAPLRPDQICNPTCATPDITWQPGGAGYQIGTTVAWRTDNTITPPFTGSDNGKIVELTGCGPPGGGCASTLPSASSGGFPAGSGFTIQVGPGILTLTAATGTLNGGTTLNIGPYQAAILAPRGGVWYAEVGASAPGAGGAGGSTISGVGPPDPVNFTFGAPASITALTAVCSAGSCAGATFAPGTTGACTGAASADNAKFSLTSGGMLSSIVTTTATTYKIGVVVNLTGATNTGTCYAKTLVGGATGSIALVSNFGGYISLSQAVYGYGVPSTVAGNTIIVAVASEFLAPPASMPTVTADNSTSCTIASGVANVNSPPGVSTGIWWCHIGGAATTTNLTFTFATNQAYCVCTALQFSGLNATPDAGLGAKVFATGSPTTVSVTSSAAITQANPLVISVVGCDSCSANNANSGQTVPQSINVGYAIGPASGTVSQGWTSPGANSASESLAVFYR